MSNRTTTNTGIAVESDDESLTAGTQGPVLLHDHYLIEKLAQFNRERVPERIVHAKGAGAYGELVITADVSKYTKAKLFQPGAKTESLARFSTVAGEQGSPDSWRDPRGFAVKFYTEDGTISSATTLRCFSSAMPLNSRTSSVRRNGCPVPGCVTTTCSGISGRYGPRLRIRSPG